MGDVDQELKLKTIRCERMSLEALRETPFYKRVGEYFSPDSLELLLNVIFEDEEIKFYDDLLQSGGISFEGVMKIVRFQPVLYRLFDEIEQAVDCMFESAGDDFYLRAIVDTEDFSQDEANPYKASLSFSVMNDFAVLSNSFELQDGMIRTILILHAYRYFNANFLERLADAAVRNGKERVFSEKIMALSFATENEADSQGAESTSLVNRGMSDFAEKLNFIKLLRSADFQSALLNTSSPSRKSLSELRSRAVDLGDTRTVKAAKFQVGGVEVQVEGAHIFEDHRRTASEAFFLAFVEVALPGDEGRYMFDVYRNGKVVLNKGRYNLREAFHAEKGADLRDALEKAIFTALVQHLESLEDEEYLDLSPENQVVVDTGEAVDPVVDLEKSKDIPLSSLGAIGGNTLKRKLNRILGSPIRIEGSHHVYVSRKVGVNVPVPIHKNKDMKRGTLKSVLEELGVTVRELKEA